MAALQQIMSLAWHAALTVAAAGVRVGSERRGGMGGCNAEMKN